MTTSVGTPSLPIELLAVSSAPSSSFSALVQNTLGVGSLVIVEGIDWTATQANPVQCFTHLADLLTGAIFFWDSQSTGEGNGVRFSWRGALPLGAGGGVSIVGTSSSSITWGAVAWGTLMPGAQ